MRKFSAQDRLRSAAAHGGFLCVSCRRCARRGLVPIGNLGDDDGDTIASLRVKCALCGSKNIDHLAPRSPAEALRWIIMR